MRVPLGIEHALAGPIAFPEATTITVKRRPADLRRARCLYADRLEDVVVVDDRDGSCQGEPGVVQECDELGLRPFASARGDDEHLEVVYAAEEIAAARERRRLARYRPVRSIEPAGEGYRHVGYRLVLADGSELHIDPASARHATWMAWGDGINGSRVDYGLCLDEEIRIRFRGDDRSFDPLLAALKERGLLPKYANERPHPNEREGYTFLMAVVGGVIDLFVIALLVSRC